MTCPVKSTLPFVCAPGELDIGGLFGKLPLLCRKDPRKKRVSRHATTRNRSTKRRFLPELRMAEEKRNGVGIDVELMVLDTERVA